MAQIIGCANALQKREVNFRFLRSRTGYQISATATPLPPGTDMKKGQETRCQLSGQNIIGLESQQEFSSNFQWLVST